MIIIINGVMIRAPQCSRLAYLQYRGGRFNPSHIIISAHGLLVNGAWNVLKISKCELTACRRLLYSVCTASM